MNTNRTGFETTENILHLQGCYGGQAEHTEMNSTKRQAFTKANEDNKEGRSFSDSSVTSVTFCSKPHPCNPCSPTSRAALMLFWLIPWLRNIPISAPGPSLCSLRSLWLNFVPPLAPFRVFRLFRGSIALQPLCGLCEKPLRASAFKPGTLTAEDAAVRAEGRREANHFRHNPAEPGTTTRALGAGVHEAQLWHLTSNQTMKE